MTRRYIIRIGELSPMEVLAKHPRAVVNRFITEPDTVAIVVDPRKPDIHHLWRINWYATAVHIGTIQEVEE